MSELVKKVLVGAVAGFLGAFLVDIDAWKKHEGSAFDWALASKRWVAGALSGAIGAFGLGELPI